MVAIRGYNSLPRMTDFFIEKSLGYKRIKTSKKRTVKARFFSITNYTQN